MKGREGKGPPSTDLLVCFPSRAHLTLMPKPICSPARTSSDSTARRHHHHNHIKKSSIRSSSRVVGQASPILWAKTTKPISKDVINSEPNSPKVTCAGQIKVRSSKPATGTGAGSCRNWQSVMEEIERLHNNRKKIKKKKSTAWVESFGFKKDVMQFLTCLRNIRFDFRCFGSFPTSGITSDDDDDEEDDDEEEEEENNQEPRISREASDDGETSRTVFSKWFMVLQENNNNNNNNKDLIIKKEKSDGAESNNEDGGECAVVVPPPNALLLMRCRSAPAKSWLQDRQELLVEEESNDDDDEEAEKEKQKQKQKEKEKEAMEEEEKKRKEDKLIVMRYGADFYKISTDIAKETWGVGGINNRDPLARSRSWKRCISSILLTQGHPLFLLN